MTDPLVVFLLARLEEDKQVAQEAQSDAAWRRATDVGDQRNYAVVVVGEPTYPSGITSGSDHVVAHCGGEDGFSQAEEVAEHIALWDPARVLAEVEAKRRIVERYRDERARRDAYQADDARAMEDTEQASRRRSSAARCRGLEIAVELLALPYREHPDYRKEWTP